MKVEYVCLECDAVVSHSKLRIHVESFKHYFYKPLVIP